MKQIIKRLKIWRLERGLDATQGFKFVLNRQISYLTEEITEYLRANNDFERVDALCDLTVFSLNAINGIDNDYDDIFSDIYCRKNNKYHIANIIDRLPYMFKDKDKGKYFFMDIIEICKYMIESMKFDYALCMEETLLEIESRSGAYNNESGKWEKFKDEESIKLWHRANYASCKL